MKIYSTFILFNSCRNRLFLTKCILEIHLAVVPWIEDKIKKLTENGQTKFADMTWQPFWLLHWSKCSAMLLVNNSGLVYELKKAVQSSELLGFSYAFVIYSNVTENLLLLLLFPSIYFYLNTELQAQPNFKTRM